MAKIIVRSYNGKKTSWKRMEEVEKWAKNNNFDFLRMSNKRALVGNGNKIYLYEIVKDKVFENADN